jgi:hypothetical protein
MNGRANDSSDMASNSITTPSLTHRQPFAYIALLKGLAKGSRGKSYTSSGHSALPIP